MRRATTSSLPAAALLLLLPLAGSATPRDLSAIWQPAPNPAMPPRVQVLTDVDAPSVSPRPGSPNVILVTVETWRADRLGLYGSPRATSPWLEELAKDAIVFERAVPTAPWTWPSVASIATGVYPRGHGAVRPQGPLCSEAQTLAEVFHDGGWRTGFVGSNEYFEPQEANFRQGFEYFYASGSESATKILEYAGYFLEGGWAASEPLFLHLHFFDPHCPYDPSDAALATAREVAFGPTDWEGAPCPTLSWEHLGHSCHALPPISGSQGSPADITTLRTDIVEYLDAYDGELVEMDRALRLLQATLAAGGAWQNSWVVITGDHGEQFAEHGRIGHGDDLRAETTWVPLVVRPPGGAGKAARRISQPVSLVDIPATLVDAVGLQAPPSWDGRSLLSAIRGDPLAPRPVFAETLYRKDRWGAMVVESDMRLAVHGLRPRASMYTAADRMDLKDLFAQPGSLRRRVRAARMAGLLHHELQCQTVTRVCDGGQMTLDPTHWEALRTLGYVVEMQQRGGTARQPNAPVYDVDAAGRHQMESYPADCR